MLTTSILVADDHPILCEGIRTLISKCDDLQVVGFAHDGRQAVLLTDQLRPDLVLMDIAMPEMNGIEASCLIRARHPEIRVLVLTQYNDRHYIVPILKAGASGIVLKRALVSDLLTALYAVARGEIFLSPSQAAEVADEICSASPAPGSTPHSLTSRESEILERIVMGQTTSEIAASLCITGKTVEFHRANLMIKMGARNVADLVRQALWRGLVCQKA